MMSNTNSSDSSLIITQDRDKNLKYGNLVANDIQRLRKVRDSLVKNSSGNYNVYDDSIKLSSCYHSTEKTVCHGDKLIYNGLVYTPIYNGKMSNFSYCSRRIYQSNYLNTILIATSLLGDLKNIHFDSPAQEFIDAGIIRCLELDQIWPLCSRKMYADFTQQNRDLVKFCELLKEGIISYEVVENVSKDELNGYGIFSKLKNLRQIEVNSDILLGENSAFIKKKLR